MNFLRTRTFITETIGLEAASRLPFRAGVWIMKESGCKKAGVCRLLLGEIRLQYS